MLITIEVKILFGNPSSSISLGFNMIGGGTLEQLGFTAKEKAKKFLKSFSKSSTSHYLVNPYKRCIISLNY